MKIVTLLENTACREDIAAAHGLSLYIETANHRILFDMGPDDQYLANAEKLGVDLAAVDIAFLSHGHHDHGGGLKAFCDLNPNAAIYLQKTALGAYYAVRPDQEPRYAGLDPVLQEYRHRFTFVEQQMDIDAELTLFAGVPDLVGAMDASWDLAEKTEEGFCRDFCLHEQNLLIRSEGKVLLLAGCAHRGIVNILREARALLGRGPEATFGGFHLFQLTEGDPAGDALIRETGEALLEGGTVYYTGHCTGAYAYDKLKDILGERLQPMTGGAVYEI